jgi:hypothetical protein
MEAIKEWWIRKMKQRKEREEMSLFAKADEIYQVKEYMGKIWLTHDGALVCPQEMFKGDIIEVLNQIRAMYVAREC